MHMEMDSMNPSYNSDDNSQTDDYESSMSSSQLIPNELAHFPSHFLSTDSNREENNEAQSNQLSIKHRLLYLNLFLGQYKYNHSDAAVLSQSMTHNVVHGEDLPLSYDTLKKKGNIFQPIVHKYLYNPCGLVPFSAHELNSNQIISCQRQCNCLVDLSSQPKNYLCYIQIKDYLLYLIPQVYHLLRFNYSSGESIYRDICDGDRYKELASPDTIVIYFGFDGVEYHDKPKRSLWPLVVYICELPFTLRQKLAFPIAVHTGPDQASNLALEPLINELVTYMNEPIEFDILINGELHKRRLYVKLLLGICDAPARAKVLQMVQHNGYYGCNYCTILSTSHPTLQCMVFPLDTISELRSDQEWRTLATLADQVDFNKKMKQQEVLKYKGIYNLFVC